MKTEEETICDICGGDLFYRYLAEPSKRYARRTKVGKVYIGWHRYCIRTEIARIWKEIFQAQELKRKKEPLTSINITAMMEI